jgi:hypothetical protein
LNNNDVLQKYDIYNGTNLINPISNYQLYSYVDYFRSGLIEILDEDGLLYSFNTSLQLVKFHIFQKKILGTLADGVFTNNQLKCQKTDRLKLWGSSLLL